MKGDKTNRKPLVLLLLEFLSRLIVKVWNAVKWVLWVVVWAALVMCESIHERDCLKKAESGYSVTAVLRMLSAVFVVAAYLAACTGPASVYYAYEGNWLSCATLLFVCHGIIANMSSQRANRSLIRSFTSAVKEVSLDGLHLFLILLIAFGLVDAKSLPNLFRALPPHQTYRKFIQTRARSTICMWASIPAILGILACGVRAHRLLPLWRHTKNELPDFFTAVYGEFVSSLKEFGLMCLTVCALLVSRPYLIPGFLRRYTYTLAPRYEPLGVIPIKPRQDLAFKLLSESPRCVVRVLQAVVVTLTIFRAPFMYHSMYRFGWHDADENSRREIAYHSLRLMWYDARTVIALLLTVLPTLYRLPKCVEIIRSRASSPAFYWVGTHNSLFEQCKLVVSEFPGWLKGVVVLLLGYRAKRISGSTIEEINKSCCTQYDAMKVDFPYMFMGAATMCTWRGPNLMRLLLFSCNAVERRAYCYMQLDRFKCDVMSIPCVVLLLGTFYRLPACYRSFVARREYSEQVLQREHYVIFEQSKQVIIDLPYLLMGCATLATHRSTLPWLAEYFAGKSVDLRYEAGRSLKLFLLDVACIVCYPVVCFTLWEYHPMLKALCRTGCPVAKRQIVIRSALSGVIGIRLTVHIYASLWRFPHTLKLLRDVNNIGRKQLVKQNTYAAWFDIVCLPVFLILMVTLWQARTTRTQLRAYASSKETNVLSPHWIILSNMWCLIYDIPIILGLPLSLWRIAKAVDAQRRKHDYAARLKGVWRQVKLCLFDMASVVLGAVLCCSWRRAAGKRLLREMRMAPDTEAHHTRIYAEFGQLLLDIPYAVMALCCLWRATSLWKTHEPDQALSDRRADINRELLACVADILSIFAILLTSLVPWNTASMLVEMYTLVVGLFKAEEANTDPVATVLSASTCFPTDMVCGGNMCGIRMTVQISKPKDLRFADLKMSVEGSAIWEGLAKSYGSVVKAAKCSLFPLKLTPKLCDLSAVNMDGETCKFSFELGTGRQGTQGIAQETIVSALRGLKEKDTVFALKLSTENGVLCMVKLAAQDILNQSTRLERHAEVEVAVGEEGCQLHVSAQKCVLCLWPMLPLELISLALTCVVFWRLPVFLRILFTGDRDIPTRLAMCKRAMLKFVMDIIGICCLGIIVITMWRLPSLVYESRKTGRVKRAVRNQMAEWLRDVVQLLQLLFIFGTLNMVPALAIRLKNMFLYNRSIRPLFKFLKKNKQPGDDEEERPPLLPYDVMGNVLSFVNPVERTKMGEVSSDWYEVSSREDDWMHIYKLFLEDLMGKKKKRRIAKELIKDVKDDEVVSWKSLFITLYQKVYTKRKQVPRHVLDSKQGYRFVINDEFLQAWTNLPHFFLIPLKLAGVGFAVPVYTIVYFLFVARKAKSAKYGIAHREHLFFADLLREMKLHATYWGAHMLLPFAMLAAICAFTSLVSYVLHVFQVISGFCLTLKVDSWHSRFPALGDIVMGVGCPAWVLLQLYVLWTGMPAGYGWSWEWIAGWAMYILSWGSPFLGIAMWVIQHASVAASWVAGTFLNQIVPFIPWGGAALDTLQDAVLHTGEHGLLSVYFASLKDTLEAVLPIVEQAAVAGLDSIRPGTEIVPLHLLFMPFEILLTTEGLFLKYMYVATFGTGIHLTFLTTVITYLGPLIIRVLWLLSFVFAGVRTEETVSARSPSGARPLRLYSLPFKIARAVVKFGIRVLAKARKVFLRFLVQVLKAYSSILVTSTRVCFRLGFFGDILLIPMTLVWTSWSMLVPYYQGDASLYLTSVMLTGFLVTEAKQTIRKNWQ
eukprot:TRINITY_DN148_c4_g1_i1.p1 TRINITY_DN148_c4_g1~~TRINITY_DN148_c4_g1_i1.p1  ORF type:complete len:1791 (+),score=215.36 TRINITY_DN148_c4_g1_i1:73-5445(+)